MRPFKRAAYFENIQCRTGNDFVNEDSGKLLFKIKDYFTLKNKESGTMLERMCVSEKSHQNFNR